MFNTLFASSSGGSAVGSIIYLVVLVAVIAAMWRVFTKAGQPGWAAIIPIYNYVVLMRIIGRPWWWIILLFIPLVNIVVWIMIAIDLSKSYGHGTGFAVGLILLSIIFLLILGFGDSQYVGPRGGSSTNPTLAGSFS